MTANAQSVPRQAGPPKRSFKNYLLDPRFQLKYTGMVVGVTLVVATVLGTLAYRESHAQTEMLSISMAMTDPSLTEDFIRREAEAADRALLMQIVLGVMILVVTLGATGILVTHKVVGPAFKMKLLFEDVVAGNLRVRGKLRKGDELQDVFEAYERMIETLRQRQREEIDQLAQAIQKAEASGASAEALTELVALRERMEAALGVATTSSTGH